MWDSGYIPAVECTGHHPGWESCPYGGTAETPSPRPPREGKKGAQVPREGFGFRRQLVLPARRRGPGHAGGAGTGMEGTLDK